MAVTTTQSVAVTVTMGRAAVVVDVVDVEVVEIVEAVEVVEEVEEVVSIGRLGSVIGTSATVTASGTVGAC